MTRRPAARASISAGSQLSRLPRKCWNKTSGRVPPASPPVSHAGVNADLTEPAGYGLGLVGGVLGVAAAGQDDHVDVASASGGCGHWLVRFSASVTESVMRAANWSGISSQAKWLAGRIVSLLPRIRWARYSPLDTGTRGSSAEAKTCTGTWIPGSRSRNTGSCSG